MDLVFDGNCGVCTRWALWLAKRDTRGLLQLHPHQTPGVPDRFGLSPTQVRRKVWLITPSGTYGGAAALAHLLDYTFGLRIFAPLQRLPILSFLSDVAYRLLAKYRGKLPGVQPWCQRFDCAGPASSAPSNR